jgi:hypothetical protein
MIIDGKDLDIQTLMKHWSWKTNAMLMVFSMEKKVIEGFL